MEPSISQRGKKLHPRSTVKLVGLLPRQRIKSEHVLNYICQLTLQDKALCENYSLFC